MSNNSLDGADVQLLVILLDTVGVGVGEESLLDSPGFFRVACLRPSAVGLKVLALILFFPPVQAAFAAFGSAVLVYACLSDDAFDVVIIRQGLAQCLDNDSCEAFASSVSVCFTVPHSGSSYVFLGSQNKIYSRRNSKVDLAASQSLYSLMQGNQA
ncbi:hypothetical protein HG530_007916 [Fusarium avenaceum]|nr:hypothetical protein HG530_007916 [Fusarium avenaceum]